MRADRRTCIPESRSSMDGSGCLGDWNRRPIPECVAPGVTLTRDLGSSFTTPRGKDEGRQMGGCRRYKSVTMAPASTYLSDRRYVARRPLFASDQHTSILKKTNVQDSQHEDWAGARPSSSHQHAEIDITRRYTSPRHTVPSTGLPVQHHRHTFLADSSSREDLSSALGVSDLKAGPSLDESAFASPFLGEGSDGGSLSSPSPDVHSPASPPSPRLSSTWLPASSDPHLGLSGPLWSDAPLGRRSRPAAGEGEGRVAETYLTKRSSTGYLQRQTPPNIDHMSPHQANYWACAIPRSLPPSPDRQSPSWDPDREYQALLDYTYPLRPGKGAGDREDLSKQGGSLLRKGDRGLQDSGIELDGIYSSNSLSGLDLWLSGAGKSNQVWSRNGGHRSSELHGLPRSWDSLPQVSPLPPHRDPVGYSLESLDSVLDPAGGTRPSSSRAGSQHHQRLTNAPLCTHNSSSFRGIRSTSLLFPWPRCTSAGHWDEDFRPLPDQLEELQSLAKQVREVTATLCRPLTIPGGWEDLESGDAPYHRPQIPQARQEDQEEVEKVVQASHLGNVRAEETRGAGGGGGGVNGAGGGAGQTEEPAVGQAVLREVEALVEQLSGVCLQALHSRGPVAEQEEGSSVSLMQRIQVFCANLEQLISWLHSVAHKMEGLAPPTADLESVKSSFAQYQSFQKEVTSHRPLASSVLHTGALLLSCLDSTSPVLRDTLVLIERQTKALESNTEKLFSAILSAMDSLAQGPTDRSLDTSTDRPADRQTGH